LDAELFPITRRHGQLLVAWLAGKVQIKKSVSVATSRANPANANQTAGRRFLSAIVNARFAAIAPKRTAPKTVPSPVYLLNNKILIPRKAHLVRQFKEMCP
jgi:hypothetical protein